MKNKKTRRGTAISGARAWAAAVLAAVLLPGISGCARTSAPAPAESTAPVSAQAAVNTHEAVNTSDATPPSGEDVTLYEKYGLTVAIPNAYIDRLVVVTEPAWELLEDTCLLSVYEKQSYEESLADYGEEAFAGFMFSIARYTRAQYEQFLSSDGSGQSFFAVDGTYYYGWFVATDVQFYRSGGEINIESDDWKSWIELCENSLGIRDDFIARNSLTPYSDSEFWDRDFTWDGAHMYLQYFPYYAYQDTAEAQGFTWKDVDYTLVLSQPAAAGDKGIWCVERWYDNRYGTLYYEFPDSAGQAAAEYYAALQSDADGGGDPSLLSPEKAALAFVRSRFNHQAATVDSFRRVVGEPAGNVYKLCRRVFDDMGTLQAAQLDASGSSTGREALAVPDSLTPFGSYAGSGLYAYIWQKAEKPAVISGGAVYCRSGDGSKVLSFYQQDSLLCVEADGTAVWFKPAYPYGTSPYDCMLGFYEQFSR